MAGTLKLIVNQGKLHQLARQQTSPKAFVALVEAFDNEDRAEVQNLVRKLGAADSVRYVLEMLNAGFCSCDEALQLVK